MLFFSCYFPSLFSVYTSSGEIQIEKVFSFFRRRNSSDLRNRFITRYKKKRASSTQLFNKRANSIPQVNSIKTPLRQSLTLLPGVAVMTLCCTHVLVFQEMPC